MREGEAREREDRVAEQEARREQAEGRARREQEERDARAQEHEDELACEKATLEAKIMSLRWRLTEVEARYEDEKNRFTDLHRCSPSARCRRQVCRRRGSVYEAMGKPRLPNVHEPAALLSALLKGT
ncbi:hypothetical protein MRX96_031954 [Rhipicephalus microplus]